jgi:hypothetical protein
MAFPISLKKSILRKGLAFEYPTKGDEVTVEYTGWLSGADSKDVYHRDGQ